MARLLPTRKAKKAVRRFMGFLQESELE